MDKGTPGLRTLVNDDDSKEAAAIEREIETIRGNLDGLVAELGERRHRLSPMRLATEHPIATAIGGFLVLGAIAGGFSLFRLRIKRRTSWRGRAKRLGARLGDLVDRPEKVTLTAKTSMGKKLLATAASAITAVAVRKLATRWFA